MPYRTESPSFQYDIPARMPRRDNEGVYHNEPVHLKPISATEFAEMKSSRMFATISRQPRHQSRKRLMHRDRVVARIPAGMSPLLASADPALVAQLLAKRRSVTSRVPGRPVTELSVTDTSLAAQQRRITADLLLHRTECARRNRAAHH